VKVLITGAGGFIGRALVAALLDAANSGAGAIRPSRLILLDERFGDVPTDSRVQPVNGSLTDPDIVARSLEGGVDLVFHLASVPGGAAEQNFELGLRVNLEGTLALLEALRLNCGAQRPRLVFASTIGVYGTPLPALIDERTEPAPTMSYGAQKLMGEILVRDYGRRGFIQGCSLRLPGIVARPPAASGMLSAFMSDIIRSLSAGQAFVCPVGAEGRAWWMSRICVVRNLIHAATLPSDVLRRQGTWLLPVLYASLGEVVSAIGRVIKRDVTGLVRYEPDAALQSQFASLPPLQCPASVAAGFASDGSLENLVQRALEGP